MIQNVLTHLGGISGYGIASLGLFVLAFLVVLLWVAGLRRTYVESMRALPLEDDAPVGADSRTRASSGPCHERDP